MMNTNRVLLLASAVLVFLAVVVLFKLNEHKADQTDLQAEPTNWPDVRSISPESHELSNKSPSLRSGGGPRHSSEELSRILATEPSQEKTEAVTELISALTGRETEEIVAVIELIQADPSVPLDDKDEYLKRLLLRIPVHDVQGRLDAVSSLNAGSASASAIRKALAIAGMSAEDEGALQAALQDSFRLLDGIERQELRVAALAGILGGIYFKMSENPSLLSPELDKTLISHGAPDSKMERFRAMKGRDN